MRPPETAAQRAFRTYLEDQPRDVALDLVRLASWTDYYEVPLRWSRLRKADLIDWLVTYSEENYYPEDAKS